MLKEIRQDAEKRMGKTLENLAQAFSKIRTGRAHTSLLDHIRVPYYGDQVPLSQVANVVVADARMLSVTPWEKNLVPVVEKALQSSDLGINPSTSGNVIRVILPPLTEERRRDLVKVVRAEAEGARVAIRNIRRDAISDFKSLLKEKEISEDEERHAQEETQKLTDRFIKSVDDKLTEKEEDLMAI